MGGPDGGELYSEDQESECIRWEMGASGGFLVLRRLMWCQD